MTQADLFGTPAVGRSTDDVESQTAVRHPPNPLDGLVHLLSEATTDRGARIIRVRCGAAMPKFRSKDRLAGATGWDSVVTCPRCKPQLKEST